MWVGVSLLFDCVYVLVHAPGAPAAPAAVLNVSVCITKYQYQPTPTKVNLKENNNQRGLA